MAFKTVWTLDRCDALHRSLREVAVTWRLFVKRCIFAAPSAPDAAADVHAVCGASV